MISCLRRATKASTPTKARLAAALCLLVTALPMHATQPSLPTAWHGTLQVLQQQGPGCSREPAPPYQRQVTVSAQLSTDAAGRTAGRLFVSGESQAMEATGQAGRFTLRPYGTEPAAPGSSEGTLSLLLQSGSLSGQWQEAPSTAPDACSWTQATLTLEPAAMMRGGTGPAAAQQVEHAFNLALQAERSAQASDTPAATAALDALITLSQQLATDGVANLALARLAMAQADTARFLGLRSQTAALTATAVSLHRLVADAAPEATAEALARQAALFRSQRRRTEAEALYREALYLLKAHSLQYSGTASAVHNSLGALYLRMQRLPDAVLAFRAALTADGRRQASALDMASTMNNLAHAMGSQGQRAAALALYDRALALLTGPDPAQQQLAESIRSNAAALRGDGASHNPSFQPTRAALTMTTHDRAMPDLLREVG